MWYVEYEQYYEDDGWLDFDKYFETKGEAFKFYEDYIDHCSEPIYVKMTEEEKFYHKLKY